MWACLPVEISRIDWRDYNGRMTKGKENWGFVDKDIIIDEEGGFSWS